MRAIEAINTNDLVLFKSIITEGVDTKAVDAVGRNLIFYSVIEGRLNFLNEVVSLYDLNLKDKLGWSALHYAAQENKLAEAQLLINHGADLNNTDNYGNTVIWRAVFTSKGRGEMIKLLLSHGANPTIENNKGVSALTLANRIDNYNVAQFFNE